MQFLVCSSQKLFDMKFRYLLLLFIICGCAAKKPQVATFKPDIYIYGTIVRIDTVTWIDSSRNRPIPVTVYNRTEMHNIKDELPENIHKKLVILNPGYGGTRNDYSYIANNLAIHGYLVVTIQHDLPNDLPLPTTGDIFALRKPIWENGVKSMLFVVNKMKAEYTQLDYHHITLIGHSNGGDMVMLMANEHPDFAKIIITLDNRRMPFPRAAAPRILSIRSSDMPADPNVLPSEQEQKRYKIKIVKVNTTHADMGGTGTDAQKKEINDYIDSFLDSVY